MDSIIANHGQNIGKRATADHLKGLGFDFYLKHKVVEVNSKGKKVTVKAENQKGENLILEGDYCLAFSRTQSLHRQSWIRKILV